MKTNHAYPEPGHKPARQQRIDADAAPKRRITGKARFDIPPAHCDGTSQLGWLVAVRFRRPISSDQAISVFPASVTDQGSHQGGETAPIRTGFSQKSGLRPLGGLPSPRDDGEGPCCPFRRCAYYLDGERSAPAWHPEDESVKNIMTEFSFAQRVWLSRWDRQKMRSRRIGPWQQHAGRLRARARASIP